LKLDPELAQAHLNLAYALQLIGRNDEALEHVQWFLKRHHETAAAHRILALIERALGHPEAALAAVRQALQLQSRNLDAALLEVELLLFLRHNDEAFQRVSELANHFGDEQRLLVLRVQAAVRSGHTEEAQKLHSRLKRLVGAG
jgi:tetratricopeptide (TPR) repeat protein